MEHPLVWGYGTLYGWECCPNHLSQFSLLSNAYSSAQQLTSPRPLLHKHPLPLSSAAGYGVLPSHTTPAAQEARLSLFSLYRTLATCESLSSKVAVTSCPPTLQVLAGVCSVLQAGPAVWGQDRCPWKPPARERKRSVTPPSEAPQGIQARGWKTISFQNAFSLPQASGVVGHLSLTRRAGERDTSWPESVFWMWLHGLPFVSFKWGAAAARVGA